MNNIISRQNETSKKRGKKRKFKKANKIFKETSFDSSDESLSAVINPVQPITESRLILSHPDTKDSYECESILNITPSKSECELNKSLTIDSEVTDISFVLNEDDLDSSSLDSDSLFYINASNELMDVDTDVSDAKVISTPMKNNIKEPPEDNFINKTPKELISDSSTKRHKKKLKIPESDEISANFLQEDFDISKDNRTQTAQYCHTTDGTIVILSKCDTIYFYGFMSLTILHGEVEVLGYIITKNSQDARVYSPRGTSLLYLKNVTKSNVPITNYLLNLSVTNNVELTENCAIVLCKKLHDPNILFIEKHMSQQILPKCDDSLPRVVFEPDDTWNLLKINQQWDDIINNINESTKMLIAGGKGVGKTTFLRWAINKLLMKFKEVRIIDLDPGQSEFTVPGCISIITIDEPIFGPNYTHLKKAERSILSNINIAYEPEKYIACVKALLKPYDASDSIPTLINYMGYVHGIGINLLSAVIMSIEPTDVLQINSQNPKKNYKNELNLDVVKKSAKLFLDHFPNELTYNLYQIESMCDENDGWTTEPRQLREMCVLSYISQMVDSNTVFKTKHPMYKIGLSKIKLRNLNGEEIHPAAVNACLVALCSLEDETLQIFQCFGWGIVRGIDISSSTLILLTPENLETLDRVSYLVMSGASLPPSIYMSPDEVKGQMPYVVEGILSSLGQIPKRSKMSVKNNLK